MANIIKAYHGEMREESKKERYHHLFNKSSCVKPKGVIIND